MFNKCARNFAFTLAEVLITLGIIGVVAALTLPSLIQNYKKKAALTGLQKGYSIIENAFKRAEAKHGSLKDWPEWDNAELIISKYLKPELNNAIEMGVAQDRFKAMCLSSSDKLLNSGNAYYFWLGGRVIIKSPFQVYKTASIQLADGSCIGINPILNFSGDSDYKGYIFIDINGNAKPNIAGEDLFFFYINNKGIIRPVGDDWSDDGLVAEVAGYGKLAGACNRKNNIGGRVCAAKIMRDGWKINYDW